jgi:hypothetical protein
MTYTILPAALLVLISLFYSFNFPAFIVEFFWILISLYGIFKYFWKGKKWKCERVKKFLPPLEPTFLHFHFSAFSALEYVSQNKPAKIN